MRAKVIIVMICALLLMGVPSFVTADTFDIGEKGTLEYTSSRTLYKFDSECWLYINPDFINYAPLLFDNNISTGIDQFIFGHSNMNIDIIFDTPLYVTNITVLPMFGGSTTDFTLTVFVWDFALPLANSQSSTQPISYDINSTIDRVRFDLHNAGTDQFNFNEVLINYTIPPSDTPQILERLDNLESNITTLQNQIDSLTQQIVDLNLSLALINLTQQGILVHISNLWTAFYQLNATLTSFIGNHEDYNDTWLIENITTLQTSIDDIYDQLGDIPSNDTNLTDLWTSINQTTQDINRLDQNLTNIQASIPEAYNDTVLRDRMTQLEGENSALRSDNTALQTRIAELESEIPKLRSDIDELEDDEDEDEEISGFLSTLPLILSILALIGVVAMLGWWASRSPQKKSKIIEDDDEEDDEEEDDEDEDEEDEEEDDEPVREGKAEKVDELDMTIKKLKK